MDSLIYTKCTTPEEYEKGKKMFREYVNSLKVDLSFQDFEKELEAIEIQYGPPGGVLILATLEHDVAGCVGVRRIDMETAELKRMYVKPAYRGRNIGAGLLNAGLESATQLGYNKLRLDTLHDMHSAIALYRNIGFYEINAYRFNPLEGAIYMEKMLQ